MRFLVDECTGPLVAQWLRSQSHEVYSVYNETRGMSDEDVLDEARSGDWILITNDKGSGKWCSESASPITVSFFFGSRTSERLRRSMPSEDCSIRTPTV